jgi:hypothetical protein
MLSSRLESAGLIVHMTATLAFPDNDGCKMRVSFESRNGIWLALFFMCRVGESRNRIEPGH